MVELIYLIKENEVFFEGVSVNSQVWMSHSDSVKALPTNGVKLASTHVELQLIKLRVKRPMRFNTIKFSLHRRVKNARKFFSKIAEVPQNFTPNACRRYGC
jgi:GMP synthase (glutamine-hydrolysing)